MFSFFFLFSLYFDFISFSAVADAAGVWLHNVLTTYAVLVVPFWMHFSVWCFTEFMRIRFNRLQLLNALSFIFSSFKFKRLPLALDSRIRIDFFSFYFYLCLCMMYECSDLGSRCLWKHKVCVNIESDYVFLYFEGRQDGREWRYGTEGEEKERIPMAVVSC